MQSQAAEQQTVIDHERAALAACQEELAAMLRRCVELEQAVERLSENGQSTSELRMELSCSKQQVCDDGVGAERCAGRCAAG